ncbi:hypothetical protein [Fischerella sp. PCC 9605]|uniref:hypothetical protein n=1 Tax=Fischerella sp. PCC 9605 TaxID=1173024 RepID=UPI001E431615|nr:hypothetical protein [Fischerella sp. PCC 9605]
MTKRNHTQQRNVLKREANYVFKNLALHYDHPYRTHDGDGILPHVGTASQDELQWGALDNSQPKPL